MPKSAPELDTVIADVIDPNSLDLSQFHEDDPPPRPAPPVDDDGDDEPRLPGVRLGSRDAACVAVARSIQGHIDTWDRDARKEPPRDMIDQIVLLLVLLADRFAAWQPSRWPLLECANEVGGAILARYEGEGSWPGHENLAGLWFRLPKLLDHVAALAHPPKESAARQIPLEPLAELEKQKVSDKQIAKMAGHTNDLGDGDLAWLRRVREGKEAWPEFLPAPKNRAPSRPRPIPWKLEGAAAKLAQEHGLDDEGIVNDHIINWAAQYAIQERRAGGVT